VTTSTLVAIYLERKPIYRPRDVYAETRRLRPNSVDCCIVFFSPPLVLACRIAFFRHAAFRSAKLRQLSFNTRSNGIFPTIVDLSIDNVRFGSSFKKIHRCDQKLFLERTVFLRFYGINLQVLSCCNSI